MTVAPATRVAMVRPPLGTVVRGVVPLHLEPRVDSELVDQAIFGEVLTVLGEDGEWRYVQGPDLYFGWCDANDLKVDIETRGAVVGVLGARVFVPHPLTPGRSGDEGEPVDVLPAGAPFDIDERDSPFVAADGRWVDTDDITLVAQIPHRYPTPDDLIATAEAFLGVPYLWGGTSAHGIDCSGLTQRVYLLNGVGLDRDADQQALGGRPVDVARPGDLFFFGKDRVTHTAIATGERTFIHAPQSGKSVQRGELTGMSPLRATRRYLP